MVVGVVGVVGGGAPNVCGRSMSYVVSLCCFEVKALWERLRRFSPAEAVQTSRSWEVSLVIRYGTPYPSL